MTVAFVSSAGVWSQPCISARWRSCEMGWWGIWCCYGQRWTTNGGIVLNNLRGLIKPTYQPVFSFSWNPFTLLYYSVILSC